MSTATDQGQFTCINKLQCSHYTVIKSILWSVFIILMPFQTQMLNLVTKSMVLITLEMFHTKMYISVKNEKEKKALLNQSRFAIWLQASQSYMDFKQETAPSNFIPLSSLSYLSLYALEIVSINYLINIYIYIYIFLFYFIYFFFPLKNYAFVIMCTCLIVTT